VALFSQEGFFSEGLSIISNVLFQIVDSSLDLVSSGNQQTVNQILSSCNVGFSVLDVLFQLDHQRVVLVGSGLEIEFQLLQGFIEVINQFLNGVDQFLNGSSNS